VHILCAALTQTAVLAVIREKKPPSLVVQHACHQCLMLQCNAQHRFRNCRINNGLACSSCTMEMKRQQSIDGSIRYGAYLYTVHALCAALTQFAELAVIRSLVVEHACLSMRHAAVHISTQTSYCGIHHGLACSLYTSK